MGRLTIAARPPRFLQVTLDTGGQGQMQHQAHIGTIHSHAKGHRRDQHRARLVLKMLQGQLATGRIHAGVIRDGGESRLGQPLRPFLHRQTGTGIDEDGAPGLGHSVQHLGQGLL